MDSRRRSLLEMKRVAGLANDTELAELYSTPLVLGEGLAVPPPSPDASHWQQRWEAADTPPSLASRSRTDAPAPEESPAAKVTHTDEGLILCKPEDEPSPANKPRTYRPNVLGRG